MFLPPNIPSSFLVREVTKGERYTLCVNDRGVAINFPIDFTQDRKCSVDGRAFNSLNQLVTFLRFSAVKGRDGKALRLTGIAPGGSVFVE